MWKRLLFIGVVCVLCSSTLPLFAVNPTRETQALAKLRVAEHYLDASATDQAIPVLQDVIAQFPETEAAQTAKYRTAYCYAFSGQHQEAITLAQSVIDANTGTAIAAWSQVLIGSTYAAMGKEEDALDALYAVGSMSAGLTDQSASFEARVRMGEIGVARGRGHHWSPAKMMDFDEASSSLCAWATATVAGAYAKNEDFAKAIHYFSELQKDYPDSKSDIAWAAARIGEAAVYLWGILKPGPQDIQNIKSLLVMPRSLTPQNKLLISRAEYVLAYYLINIERDYAQAESLLSRTAADCPATEFSPFVRYQRAVALRRLGRYSEAAGEFRAVSTSFPKSGYAAPALYNAGVCNKEIGRIAEARAALMELLDTKLEEEWRLKAREELGRCLLKEGELSQAADDLQSASNGWLGYEDRAPVTPNLDMRDNVLKEADRLIKDAQSLREKMAEQGE